MRPLYCIGHPLFEGAEPDVRMRSKCITLDQPRRRKVMDESAGDDKGQRLVWVDMEVREGGREGGREGEGW